jgi:hypothetical protein
VIRINKTWPHLHVIETVGTMKLANKLETAVGRIIADPSLVRTGERSDGCGSGDGALDHRTDPMKVFVQINTSGEAQKSGVAPGDSAIALAKHVEENVRQQLLSSLVPLSLSFISLSSPICLSVSHVSFCLSVLPTVPSFDVGGFDDDREIRW